MRRFTFLSVLILMCLFITGCPPQTPPDTETRDIGQAGGIVQAGGGSLQIPPGSISNTTKITMERNKSGVAVDTTPPEMPVSDIYSITQDAGIVQAKGDTRLLLTLPYNASAVKANTNGQVYALVNTPDARDVPRDCRWL